MKLINVLYCAFLLCSLSCTYQKNESPRKISIIPCQSPSNASFRGLAILDTQNAWVTGTQGTVLQTQDGGKNWREIEISGSDSLDFRDVEILDKKTVLLMSIGNGSASRIYKSVDAGKNWRISYQNEAPKAFFDGFDFWDNRSAMMISDPIDDRLFLLKTEDGGENWNRVGANSLPPLMEGEYGFAASGTGIVTKDKNKVWIATGGSVARIFYSPDRGNTWQVFNSPVTSGNASSGIFSIAFRDAMHGVAVGGDYQNPDNDAGNIARTSDGGKTWQAAEKEPPIFHKASVQYLGERAFLAVGRTGIAFSRDDGAHWEVLSKESYYCLAFDVKSGVGYMAGVDGRIARVEWK